MSSSSSSSSSTMPSLPNPHFDEHQWILHIQRTLQDELDFETEIPISIFNVPKNLIVAYPDSYTPQQVTIGPFHYWRPELYEAERLKLAAARRTQRRLCRDANFQHIVDQILKVEHRIRGCYSKFLELSHQALAWMMAIDASFLLDFMSDFSQRKSAHNAVLKDLVMMENKIPLFVLRMVIEFQFESVEASDEMLEEMVFGFLNEVSPLKMMQLEKRKIRVLEGTHLLDCLYNSMVPKIEASQSEITEAEGQGSENRTGDSLSTSYIKDLFSEVWKIVSKIQKGPFRLLQKVLKSKALKFVLKLPWKILSKLPWFSVITQPVELLLTSDDKGESKPENDGLNSDKPPLVEEIAIPCVSELSKSGVRFVPMTGNIKSVSFNPKTVTFHLPVLTLDSNSEVVLRNLVAYEASTASGPLVFTRYTELMNGIIDTEEDVKILRESGVLLSRMKSDKDVADVWTGMNKSIRLTKVPFLDKVIEDVNKHYNGRWKVKARNFMKKYVFGSWQCLTLVAAVMLLILMTLQAFCSVYNCARIFHVQTS